MSTVKKLNKKQQKVHDDAVEVGLRIREKVRNKICDAIEKRKTSLNGEEIKERARKIEISIYNNTIRGVNQSHGVVSKMKSMPKTIKYCKGMDELERVVTFNQLSKMPNSKLEPKWTCLYFRNRYINKASNLIFNLKDTRNPRFIQAIVDKSVPLREIANLKADEIFPELWEPIKKRLWEKQVILGQPQNINDGIAQCGKCKSYKTTYYSLQTRSADEPMTNFFTCHNCGKRWKT